MLILCKKLKNKLEHFEKHRAVGAVIRAKIKWRRRGETCNKYFLNLEKNKLARTVITEINTGAGETKTHTDEIMAEFERFYENLYNTEEERPSKSKLSFPKHRDQKNLGKQQKNHEKPIEPLEIKKAITDLDNNKSPGSDGLTAEFYKSGFTLLGKSMTTIYNYILKSGEMTQTQKEAVIVCLYKKGKKK